MKLNDDLLNYYCLLISTALADGFADEIRSTKVNVREVKRELKRREHMDKKLFKRDFDALFNDEEQEEAAQYILSKIEEEVKVLAQRIHQGLTKTIEEND